MNRYELHQGDNREVLKTFADNSMDSIVCDPPYELAFMGKRWDSTGIAYDASLWAECLRVLKPGGHLIAFGGTRTYHRMTVAIEDAGFEIRDCIMWMYGSGFPKSLDVSKAIDKQAGAEREVVGVRRAGISSVSRTGDMVNGVAIEENKQVPITAPATPEAQQWHGYGTALKPAVEPAVLARKPLSGTVADNVLTWGVGAINIDGCRVGSEGGTKAVNFGEYTGRIYGNGKRKPTNEIEALNTGRWPANVLLDEDAAEALDAQSGVLSRTGSQGTRVESKGLLGLGGDGEKNIFYGDSGGASRFFYTAKASRAEREAGLEGMSEKTVLIYSEKKQGALPQQTPSVPSSRANHHPTVKPIALMRYLVRLVTPKGGTVLDPFMGSGSTGCAAMLEGMRFVGIDLTPEYVEIAERRIQHWMSQNPMEI